mmetsp:Transcript_19384/g.29746  ORF Transcript_19384/g.29746 Transcript_19384/m.29746 type:complete len:95 (-) Transcript_19384:102-386(-)
MKIDSQGSRSSQRAYQPKSVNLKNTAPAKHAALLSQTMKTASIHQHLQNVLGPKADRYGTQHSRINSIGLDNPLAKRTTVQSIPSFLPKVEAIA